MSDVVTAARAAEAALAAAAGARTVAIGMLVRRGAAVQRIIVHESGAVEGALAGEADDRARRIAAELLREVAGAPRSGSSDETPAGSAARLEGPAPGDAPVVEDMIIDGVECTLYVEVHRAPEQLVIVGAGHIAVPLAQLGVLLDFRVTVLDDREDMATPERFDERVHVVRADFGSDPFAGIALGAHSYVALVTRGHQWDFDCLQRVIRRDERPRYIGMIGSRRRVRAAFHALLESGVARELLATIRAPIGLELQAETPAEIAVAIAAEIIAVRHGASVASISSRERVMERLMGEGV